MKIVIFPTTWKKSEDERRLILFLLCPLPKEGLRPNVPLVGLQRHRHTATNFYEQQHLSSWNAWELWMWGMSRWWNGEASAPAKMVMRHGMGLHMGQFLQGGKNGRLMSFFFLKVEPPCDQIWWDSPVFSILSCFSYVSHAENTLVGPVGPF